MVKAAYYPYCVKCSKKVNPESPKMSMAASGRKMLKGKCPHCETNVTRFLAACDKKSDIGL